METEVPNKIVERLKKLMRLQQSAQKSGQKVKQMPLRLRLVDC